MGDRGAIDESVSETELRAAVSEEPHDLMTETNYLGSNHSDAPLAAYE